ncbi:60 kDa SS-A/Ro ribonucleoprotein [Lingula anatina]|uniref:60 kDa SS-A/Ro ribonucleoprotein n=1 Tax=Lingula anatina TaxID=7574 RepID=A0A1S3KBY8_LINAN|nr:60 kDa SS-A/Ro ribonucleoprotein [Lingula anatina]|eukprot:XP_013419954.1 60 kDa SS-A/Ro ribonucleoprotein [Lingula anatina]
MVKKVTIDPKRVTWALEDMDKLKRYICLGSETPTARVAEDHEKDHCENVIQMVKTGSQGPQVVELLKEYSVKGYVACQKPLIRCLAICVNIGDGETKKAALKAMPEICRIPTDLFLFVQYCVQGLGQPKVKNENGSWGRAMRTAVSQWYLTKEPKNLAYLMTKYRKRYGWSHVNLFNLTHPKPTNEAMAAIFTYEMKGLEAMTSKLKDKNLSDDVKDLVAYLKAVHEVKHSTDIHLITTYIEEHSLVWEHVPSNTLKLKEVWQALLPKMPTTAMLRNLFRLAALGLLQPGSTGSTVVIERLRNESKLREARIHPFNLLVTRKAYNKGKTSGKPARPFTGKGKGKPKEKQGKEWTPNSDIVKALDEAFYTSFKCLKPTKKSYLMAVDVSQTMHRGRVNGTKELCAIEAAAAMAMVIARSEEKYEFVAFAKNHPDGLSPVELRSDSTWEDLMLNLKVQEGKTDCALPMLWAKKHQKPYDVFMVFTDSETLPTDVQPKDALAEYRAAVKGGEEARLVVCAMNSQGFTIADPNDARMLDVVGFAPDTPEKIHQFVLDFNPDFQPAMQEDP